MRDFHHNQLNDQQRTSKMTTSTVVAAKSDSDVTSNTGSSPTRAQIGAVYYVQSPSRDSSHDGEKTTNSFNSSPAALSPMGSPPHDSHSNSSLGRNSSSTRFSGSLKPSNGTGSSSSDKLSGSGRTSVKLKGGRRWGKSGGGGEGWNGKKRDRFDKIEEEEGLLSEEEGSGVTKRCRYVIGFVVAFSVLFSFFAVVLWSASRNQKPFIYMKSVRFENFVVQSGTDNNGVPTAMTTINATVKLVYRNRGTFFGVHVTSTPLNLYYRNLLVLATGTMDRFYQARKSKRWVVVRLGGTGVPVYGGGSDLSSEEHGLPSWPVGLTLSFRVTSRAYVLGRLVKPRFRKDIICDLTMSSKKMNKPIPLRNLCTYQ